MKTLNMVCKVLAKSEYIEGCDISKWGEGCERCVPLEWKIPLAFLICFGFIIFVIFYLKKLKKKAEKRAGKN